MSTLIVTKSLILYFLLLYQRREYKLALFNYTNRPIVAGETVVFEVERTTHRGEGAPVRDAATELLTRPKVEARRSKA